jgi:hypothetical protein
VLQRNLRNKETPADRRRNGERIDKMTLTNKRRWRPVSPGVRWEGCIGCGQLYQNELDWFMSSDVEISSLGVRADLCCPVCIEHQGGCPAYLAPASVLLSSCPDCQAQPFERCRRDPINIDDPELSGHVKVCGGRITEPPAILIGDSDPEGEAMP